MNKTWMFFAAALMAPLTHGTAFAHVTLEARSALAGSSYKAVLGITHGCEGTATHTITVRLPAGFRGAKPMPKPGWTLTLQRAPLAQPYESHGRKVTEDVVEISWKASSREAFLANAHYDEFVFRGQTPAQAGPLWFKVLQLCEKGQWDWSEVPASGTSTQDLRAPAVLLDVQPNEHAGHSH